MVAFSSSAVYKSGIHFNPRISIEVLGCLYIRGLIRPLVGPSVGWSVTLSSNSVKNGLVRNLNNLDIAGRGRKRDEEEGGTRREEGRGGRMDEEEGAIRRVKK